MANLMPVISDLTLLDLSLPGTHDTLTYDLSTTVSDAGIDDYDELSKILHLFSGLIPGQIEDFIRQQAKTQVSSGERSEHKRRASEASTEEGRAKRAQKNDAVGAPLAAPTCPSAPCAAEQMYNVGVGCLCCR
jgi:hypothetical protein